MVMSGLRAGERGNRLSGWGSRFGLALAVLATVPCLGGPPDDEAGPPTADKPPWSAEGLARELTAQSTSLTALSLVYREEPEGNKTGRPHGAYLRRVLMARGPYWFLRDNAHGHDGFRWEDDPWRKQFLITPDGATLVEHLNRVIMQWDLDPSTEAPADVRNEFIFQALGWWPFSRWSPPQVYGRPWSLPRLLKEDRYRLRPRTAPLRSRPCAVFELPQRDVLWVDSARPRCVLRRDVYNPRTGALASRYDMDDFYEAGDGVWLPRTIRNRQFDPEASTPELQARLIIDATFRLENIKINRDVSTDAFRLDLTPGTVRRVVTDGPERVEPIRDGQDEHFRSVLTWSKSVAGHPRQGTRESPRDVLLSVLVGLVLGLTAFSLLERVSRAVGRGTPRPGEPAAS